MNSGKPLPITKRMVWEAYKLVKKGKAAGVDGQSLEDFAGDLENHRYRLWNRLVSGSYFPPPVRRVEIPKAGGGIRPLGIPTVADRIAQMVVKRCLEPVLDGEFDPDSYGYRPGKSAHQAIEQARKRCWQHDWVVDLDIKSFFDTIDHELLMRAVYRHTKADWIRLYIERWLKAPVEMPDGSVRARTTGRSQGGVVSPILANLFLHYVFDVWMKGSYPHIPFERYADDIICHCRTRKRRNSNRRWNDGLLTAIYCCIRRRLKWSTALTAIDGGPTRRSILTSWALASAPVWRRTGGAGSSPASFRA
ncbi:group II intron reverse transcriptase/maturase [Bradyrhizobium daqingense]|uniref:RNA-directed DNA polymerase n=1 Tax=Bradyrhizobium daqingense TaxID=993502 RepID=A0A562K3V2_9BRAD|nr:group II intron reverse transcriptase/maturase [Bradyrhizobium daqingense]TWH90090.1 group II intron reverse transcriptase/maturase [Bradyrhizobium daqingense]UFS88913.1 group II intron reverse transcriptase/maturase [Bradyrhizobium daqingense]